MKLFEKAKFGDLELKNRLIMSPMVTNYCSDDGKPTERFIAYHEARARGGVGLQTVEACYVTLAGRGFAHQAGLHKDENIEAWKVFTDRIHQAGGRVSAQLYHGGRQTSKEVTGMELEAPSAIPCPLMGGDPKELRVERIRQIVKEFGEAARRAKEAGFDAVEIHGAHGYLLTEFQSPYSNHRTDEYGGSVENRERFPLEVLRAVRGAVGEGFPISYRLSAVEDVEGGLTIEDTCRFAARLVENGASAIHCSRAVYETAHLQIPPASEPVALNVENAARIREAIDGAIPVFVAGRIKDYKTAEDIIEQRKADFIVMGRALLCDPELPNKMREGRFDEIRKCLSCNQGCIDELFVGHDIGCMINPLTGHEYEEPLDKTDMPQKVLVIGGGPAGMEAALIAAQKGHEVTLAEKEDHLGGQLLPASAPPGKQDFQAYIRYQQNELERTGVKVMLNTILTAQQIRDIGADTVILAVGSVPVRMKLPGMEQENVLAANDVLCGSRTGNRVAVIGGGLVGCETAEYLLAQGKEVVIVEMLPEIAKDMGVLSKMSMLSKFGKADKLTVYTNCALKEIAGNTVLTEKEGAPVKIDGIDTVVIAVGSKAVQKYAEMLSDENIIFEAVGDAVRARRVMQAVGEGFEAAIGL